jgi:NADPH:quinone reductase-like Zn-dependent oxidoreductase
MPGRRLAPAHGRCAQAELLATQAATATSALDGSVTFSPASLANVATNMTGVAVTGNSGSVSIAIEQHP